MVISKSNINLKVQRIPECEFVTFPPPLPSDKILPSTPFGGFETTNMGPIYKSHNMGLISGDFLSKMTSTSFLALSSAEHVLARMNNIYWI